MRKQSLICLYIGMFACLIVGVGCDWKSRDGTTTIAVQKSWQRLAAESVCAKLKTETNDERRRDVREYVRGLLSLERGGDPDRRFSNGDTLLLMAVRRNDKDIVKRMLSLDIYADVDCIDKKGNTPLIVACEQGDVEIAGQLIEAGAQVNLQNTDGMTALMACAKQGSKPIAQMLLSAGVNIYTKDKAGRLFGDYALDHGHDEIVSIISARR